MSKSFTHEHLDTIEFVHKIGEGSYSVVRSLKNFPNIAVKEFIDSNNISYDEAREMSCYKLINEMCPETLMKSNIIDIKKHRIFLPKMKHTFGNIINKPTNKAFLKDIFFKLAKGLNSMHNINIIHADLKPDNIMIDLDKNPHIIDYGMTQHLLNDNGKYLIDTKIQTLWYRCPEILLINKNQYSGDGYSSKIDVWSLAIVILDLIAGGEVMIAQNPTELLLRISTMFGTIPKSMFSNTVNMSEYGPHVPDIGNNLERWKKMIIISQKTNEPTFLTFLNRKKRVDTLFDQELCNLLTKMTEIDPNKRIDMTDVLNSTYFDDIRPCIKVPNIGAGAGAGSGADAGKPASTMITRLSPIEKACILQRPYLLDIMNIQTDITYKMIGILYDWLLEVNSKFKFGIKTFIVCLEIIDTYLKNNIINRANLQKIGVCSLHLATLAYEESFGEIEDYVYLTDNAYNKKEINTACLSVFDEVKNIYFTTEVDVIVALYEVYKFNVDACRKAITLCVLNRLSAQSSTSMTYRVTALSRAVTALSITETDASKQIILSKMPINNTLKESMISVNIDGPNFINNGKIKKHISLMKKSIQEVFSNSD
jgi:serine/threonine protein kinase